MRAGPKAEPKAEPKAMEVAVVALGSLGAGLVLFLATGMLCTAAILASTKAARPARALASRPPRPRTPPEQDAAKEPTAALHLDWMDSARGRTR